MDTLFPRGRFWNDLINMEPLKDLKFNIPQVLAYTAVVTAGWGAWITLNSDVKGLREDFVSNRTRTEELQKIIVQMNENGTAASRAEQKMERFVLDTIKNEILEMKSDFKSEMGQMKERSAINMPRMERVETMVDALTRNQGLPTPPKK